MKIFNNSFSKVLFFILMENYIFINNKTFVIEDWYIIKWIKICFYVIFILNLWIWHL